MEPSSSASPEPSAPAELIVRNGRQQGASRPLKVPVTIIGSSKGCDIRLNVESVRPVHCVIALGPEGPHLRSFGAGDTLVKPAAPAFHQTVEEALVHAAPPAGS
jgi:hypothetical protein